QKPNTWGELLNIITEDVEWKEELDEQFWNSISGQLAYPTGFTFRGVQDGRNFRAMITRIECADTKISRISIVFIPEHKPAKIGGLAFNLLSFSTRFKYEVINTFFGKLDEKINKNGEEQTFCNLLGAIRNIEREADQFGIMDPDTVKTAFSEKGKDRDTVTEMFKIWGPLRDEIFLCAKRKDASDMERLLGELRVINAEFIRMVTRRHCELIEDDVSTLLDN
ncbi:MAG: hypothetical protein GY799_09935, partial [Desulfobulbaceae bacterium]|nr:hypothetical protein [Desulfobulbaceae bacterium]